MSTGCHAHQTHWTHLVETDRVDARSAQERKVAELREQLAHFDTLEVLVRGPERLDVVRLLHEADAFVEAPKESCEHRTELLDLRRHIQETAQGAEVVAEDLEHELRREDRNQFRRVERHLEHAREHVLVRETRGHELPERQPERDDGREEVDGDLDLLAVAVETHAHEEHVYDRRHLCVLLQQLQDLGAVRELAHEVDADALKQRRRVEDRVTRVDTRRRSRASSSAHCVVPRAVKDREHELERLLDVLWAEELRAERLGEHEAREDRHAED